MIESRQQLKRVWCAALPDFAHGLRRFNDNKWTAGTNLHSDHEVHELRLALLRLHDYLEGDACIFQDN